MDNQVSQNGHRAENGQENDPGDHLPVNAYADAVRGTQPPEIADFELGTDPYANMLPRVRTLSAIDDDDTDWTRPRRRNPLFIAISLILIVVLILPAAVLVLARLGI